MSIEFRPPSTPRAGSALLFIACFLSLAGCNDRIGNLIAELQSSPDPAKRRAAAVALGEQTPPTDRAVTALAKAADDTDPEVQQAAMHALGQLGPAARSGLPALRKTLDNSQEPVRLKAALTIARIDPDDPSFRPSLISAMLAADGRTLLAVGAMGKNAAWAVPTLLRLLPHREAKVRVLAARTLGRLGPAASEAKLPLQQLLDDPNAAVRGAAQDALKQIKTAAEGSHD